MLIIVGSVSIVLNRIAWMLNVSGFEFVLTGNIFEGILFGDDLKNGFAKVVLADGSVYEGVLRDYTAHGNYAHYYQILHTEE